jgi:sialidase-1
MVMPVDESFAQDLFVSGREGYVRYRIPALVSTVAGTILAFCEARKFTGRDSDQIDLFVRRSTDGGRTFGPRKLIATQPNWVCGNPAPVVDGATGTIWLPFCKNLRDGDETMICEGRAPRSVWITCSVDDGESWREPQEISGSVKPEGWSWYATGPGHGIQLRTGPHAGRLLVPCDHVVFQDYVRSDPHHSHIIYSEDHGQSWQIGACADEGTNESTLLETSDGWLYLNCRNKYHLTDGGNYRAVAWSRDGGLTVSPIVHDAALPEPICQASVCRLTWPSSDRPGEIVFLNPGHRSGRYGLTLRLSTDECRTWSRALALHRGPAAYSDLCIAPDGAICCLFECGEIEPYERIKFLRLSRDALWAAPSTASQ